MRTKINRKNLSLASALFSITDIVMNIFIFFFITFNIAATLKSGKETHLKNIDVPHKSSGTSTTPPTKLPLEVLIKKEGELEFKDSSGMNHQVTLEGILSEINKSDFNEEPDQKTPSVVVVTNRQTAYGYVIKVLDTVKKNLKYKKVGLTAADF